MQKCCREIDTVTVRGSIKPLRLFTIDIDVDGLERTKDPMVNKKLKEKKFMRDQMRHKMFKRLYTQEKTTWEEFNNDHEFIELRQNVDENFETLFRASYKLYIEGNWA